MQSTQPSFVFIITIKIQSSSWRPREQKINKSSGTKSINEINFHPKLANNSNEVVPNVVLTDRKFFLRDRTGDQRGGEWEPQIRFTKSKGLCPNNTRRTSKWRVSTPRSSERLPALRILPQKSQNSHAKAKQWKAHTKLAQPHKSRSEKNHWRETISITRARRS